MMTLTVSVGRRMDDWNTKYEEACRELQLAQEEYRIADSALARALARLNAASARTGRLYQDRINEINPVT